MRQPIESEPFYFGASGQALFGCFHPASATVQRNHGLLLCYPWGNEYIYSHRAYQLLATRLSRAGFPVLRFDYFASGDSGGECEQVRLPRWQTDISEAADELRQRSGVTRLGLVGLRLGATLAMMAAAKRDNIDALVLWDPVVKGADYLAELSALQKETLRLYPQARRETRRGERYSEINGFPFTADFQADIESIDLLSVAKPPARSALLVATNESNDWGPFRQHLELKLEVRLSFQLIPGPQIWTVDPTRRLVPTQVLEAIGSWLPEALA